MPDPIERKKQSIGEDLEEVVEGARELAEELGLKPRSVNYWVVDQDEINELAAYGGFQERYPHWRWGMKYDRQRKQSEYSGGKIFEMVNNDTPCHAFLQMSNSLSDQKSVITHVEAHSDFFANNEWFQDQPAASDMLARHSEKILGYMQDPDIEREEVEKWIDNILCLEDNIDQYSDVWIGDEAEGDEDGDDDDGINLNIDEDIEEVVFRHDDEQDRIRAVEERYVENTTSDVLGFLLKHGEQYDSIRERSEEYEEWQKEVLEMLREEAYYFAPQKMTKVINEGHSACWESLMMTEEGFADMEDLVDYADHSSKVLNSPGFNPYSLGKSLWEHVENTVNRREVVDKLLRMESIDTSNFHSDIDFERVHEILDKRDSDDIVERNYSLTRPQNQGFIKSIPMDELKKCSRYIMEDDRYSSLEEALAEVDYGKGWERMREVRETHNDTMFIDEFLTQEFVDDEQYYTYEYRTPDQEMQIASRDVEDVRKKLLLRFTNFGKPTIEVGSGNYDNAGELLLLHQYNGIVMNLEKAERVLKRTFDMWGRPVNLVTVKKTVSEREMDYALSEDVEPKKSESVIRLRYDGSEYSEHDGVSDIVKEEIMAEDVDYDTVPEEWVA